MDLNHKKSNLQQERNLVICTLGSERHGLSRGIPVEKICRIGGRIFDDTEILLALELSPGQSRYCKPAPKYTTNSFRATFRIPGFIQIEALRRRKVC